MKNELLHVILVKSNISRWSSREKLFKESIDHMLDSGVKLHVIEVAFNERDYTVDYLPEHVHYVKVRHRTAAWNKENLINICISRITDENWKYVAWIDADITYRKPNWASETVHALQHYNIVQNWDSCLDLGPNDELLQVHKSFCKLYYDHKPIVTAGSPKYEFAHPGYAWACTRDLYVKLGGLLETAVAGAGDHHMALAMINRAADSLPGNISPGYRRSVMDWQNRALEHVKYKIGYVPNVIEHKWHGPKAGRNYIGRWQILTRHSFDPFTDLKKNEFGVVELTGNKPMLDHDMDVYNRQRYEDANCDTVTLRDY